MISGPPLRPSPGPISALPIAILFGAMLLLTPIACRAQPTSAHSTWPLWEAYAQHSIDSQGRVIDHSAGDRTTSEGQAYALFFALVANDRARFDRILRWTETNLAAGDLSQYLPAWSWGKAPDGQWKTLDPNPASDADLWISYTLLEAGRLWHDPRLAHLGLALANQVAQSEVASVPGIGTTLLPGQRGFHPDPGLWLLNPSYLPPPVLLGLATAAPSGPWMSVLRSLGPMLRSGNGFAMDWVYAGDTGTRPAPAPGNTSPGQTALGSYDAIRVYLWIGLSDPKTPGLHALLAGTSGMSAYLRSGASPPESVDDQGQVKNPVAPIGFTAAVIPYLHALGLGAPARSLEIRLNAAKDPTSGLFGTRAVYYDQNLALFSTGFTEGRFRFDSSGKLLLKGHDNVLKGH